MSDARIKMVTPGSDVEGLMMGHMPTGGRILYKAVVIEVINFPPYVTEFEKNWDIDFDEDEEGDEEEDLESLPEAKDEVSNFIYLKNAPRNSLIVNVITDGISKEIGNLVAWPFFSSHFCMPVKPGEQVWLISESSDKLSELPYWISRCPASLYVDDVNFTHGDRKLFEIPELEGMGMQQRAESENNYIPGFPNGDNTEAGQSLSSLKGVNDLPYEDIFQLNDTRWQMVNEPVPRFYRRPGDLAIQGMNNTLISLGQDRGMPDYDPNWDVGISPMIGGNIFSSSVGESGTIDIVTGRGRYSPSPLIPTELGGSPFRTAPLTILNTRGEIEVDKQPTINSRYSNNAEGNPDFMYDSSRIYVSMKTHGDLNFGISNEGPLDETKDPPPPVGPYPGTRMALAIGNNPEDVTTPIIKNVNASPFVILKSDEVRIIARKLNPSDEEKEENPSLLPINGSIRLVKQGLANDDLATIVLLPDGTIQLSGKQIFLGRHPENGGFGGIEPDEETAKIMLGPEDAPGQAQPWVKYKQLEDLFTATFNDFASFCDKVLTHTTPGYGAPSPQLNQAVTDLKTALTERQKEIVNLRSTRIFGE